MNIYKELNGLFVCTYDQAGSVGRRYARADEQGIPFCITVDFESMGDNAVTVRDRDSTKQDRVHISELQAYFTKNMLK